MNQASTKDGAKRDLCTRHGKQCKANSAGTAAFAAECLLQAHTTPLPRLFLVELTQLPGRLGVFCVVSDIVEA